jgi:hypothetical protein
MADAAEYRRRAQECLDMAPRMNPECRPLLISIAEAWVALAEAALAKEWWAPVSEDTRGQSSGGADKAH